MFRNPSISNGKPELNEDEEILCSADLCSIQFGKSDGNGSLYTTSQRVIWLSNSAQNANACDSFSVPLISLMVHALCKDTDIPYLFLQIENQDNDIKIIHKSYNKLQQCYEALCEGQKLNPCESDSSDDEAYESNENDKDNPENDTKNSDFLTVETMEKDMTEEQINSISEMYDKLQLNEQIIQVNNNGFLEPADEHQFSDKSEDENKEKNEKLMIVCNEEKSEEKKEFDRVKNVSHMHLTIQRPSSPSQTSLSASRMIEDIVKDVGSAGKNMGKLMTPSGSMGNFKRTLDKSDEGTPSLSDDQVDGMLDAIDLDNEYLDLSVMADMSRSENRSFEEKYKVKKNENVMGNKVEDQKMNQQ